MIRKFDTAESMGRKIMQDYNERFLKIKKQTIKFLII